MFSIWQFLIGIPKFLLLCATTAEAEQTLQANPPNLPHYVAGPSWFPSVLNVDAAHSAVVASQETADAERTKWDLGFSTLENVFQTEVDLTRPQAAEIQSRVDYAKAVIAQEVAVGNLLESHGIVFVDALKGSLWKTSR